MADGKDKGLPPNSGKSEPDRRGTTLGIAVLVALGAYIAVSLTFGNPLFGALAFIAVLAVWIGIGYALTRGEIVKLDSAEEKRRMRSIALAWGLGALMVMFYVATFVQFGGKQLGLE